ncbi:ABC transporter substrate-binding protein [Virgisporangium aliadipatigenens]|uniref:ABC transporter substrate-binding protein n=1 Tax=Virgisporangium aliadipatigenens TaxID=741659 RepID=A0A8J4DSU9_9ACTN|nr:extracellular solute-binding protein [Virgisporangium aliadipatigenens]GIJ49104.1 ABC transporter substrate-binding protein [Virgisporangium aliadipatigenens]
MHRIRRAFAVLGVVLLAGCATQSEAADSTSVTLVFAAYGGAGQQAMIDRYQKPYTADRPNITFVNTSPPDLAKVRTQVENKAVKWDVIAVPPAAAIQGCGTLFEPLDLSAVDRSKLVEGTIGKCYVGNWFNANPVAYRTDAFPDPAKAPKRLADFFDLQRFPGKRAILTNLQNGILEYPLLADGVAPSSLYPLDVDRALNKLGTIRSQTTFAANLGNLQQAIATGQIDMFIIPDSRLVPLLNEGIRITIIWDVTQIALNAFAVPKGSKKKEPARQFLETLVTPAAVTGISEALGTAPIIKGIQPNLSANAKLVEVFGPVNTGQTVVQNVDWYGANFDSVTAKLANWLK